jgi:hypothetical protein
MAELTVGSILASTALLFRLNRLVKSLLAVASSVFIVHGFLYLCICAYYGSGDGRVLFDILQGKARYFFLALASLFTVGSAFFVSFAFSPLVKSWVNSYQPKKRLFLIALSVSFAIILHGTFTVTEQIISKDVEYAEIKTPVNERLMARELSDFKEKFIEEYGREATKEELHFAKKKLEMKYRQIKIENFLVVAIMAAMVAGYLFSGNRNCDETNRVTWRDNSILGSFSVLMAALIVVLNSL